MIAAILANVGHEVRVAYDLLQALSLANAFRPDVAMLDIGLPVMDGYALGRELHARFEGAPPVLIALTGYGQGQHKRCIREAVFTLRSDVARREWRLGAPLFLGHIVHHAVQEPREPSSILIAARTGHRGPTVFRSRDGVKSFPEAAKPPAFHKAPEGQTGKV